MGITIENGRFMNISMGQGQEKRAETIIESFAKTGGWVMLQVYSALELYLLVYYI
jgi:dynein heavy chain